MKKFMPVFSVAICLFMLFAVVGNVAAVKPAGATTVAWNLSGDVMPVPPYASRDILGSDTASKLIVNQPNGNTEVTLTGVMGGLKPDTTYTVYLSKSYTPYVFTGWNVTGNYTIDLTVGTTPYTEYVALTQSGTNITGTSLALAGNASPWTIESGTVIGTQVYFLAHYNPGPTLHAEFYATIDANGALVNGTWHDVAPGTRGGTWSSKSGAAAKVGTGSTGWPGLFTTTVQPFTFVTDASGAGSWHLNLKNENFTAAGTYPLSVWINDGATILISDVFSVTVE